MQTKKVIVIGAGPAGMMAAIRAAQLRQEVTLIEKNHQPGKKLLLSGKGRCNLTNLCELDPFLNKFSSGGQFLRDAFKKFFHRDLIKFFASGGLKLKVERQLRVFPVSDRSGSVLEVLKKQLSAEKVKLILKTALQDIIVQGGRVEGIMLSDGKFLAAQRIILATGGASYGFSGSTGEGIKIAAGLGHDIVPLRPGLVPLEAAEKHIRALEGIILKNIRLKFSHGKDELFSEIGELLFTGFGVSGPLVLSLSGRIVDWLSRGSGVFMEVDLKPGLSKEQLNARLLREFQLNSKKTLKKTLKALLPQRLINCVVELSGIPPDRNCSQVTRQEREKLLSLLKGFRMRISRARPLDEAMITCGGVSLKEINPRTMESRRVRGLYFAGEMIDIDADTGGFKIGRASCRERV